MHANENAFLARVRTNNEIRSSKKCSSETGIEGLRTAFRRDHPVEAIDVLQIGSGTQTPNAPTFLQLLRLVKQNRDKRGLFALGELSRDGLDRIIRGTERMVEPEKRDLHRLEAEDGKLYQMYLGRRVEFDSSAARAYTEDHTPIAIYVMDRHGTFFASNYQAHEEFHHSSILGGDPVAAGGGITASQGKVSAISNGSGHYLPTLYQLAQAVLSLYEADVLNSTFSVVVMNGLSQTKFDLTLNELEAALTPN